MTRFLDGSVEVVDHGRGMPMDYNEKEKRWNWELLFCEMYAGSKYNTNNGGTYEYSLGLNGLGLCATQYASEYMDAEVHKNGFRYEIHFKAGEPVSELQKPRAFATKLCIGKVDNLISHQHRISPLRVLKNNTLARKQ